MKIYSQTIFFKNDNLCVNYDTSEGFCFIEYDKTGQRLFVAGNISLLDKLPQKVVLLGGL